MGLDNPVHIAFLLILLLLVFGAKRLPEMGRSLGAGMRGFKESLTGENTQLPLTTQHQPAPVVTPASAFALAATGPQAVAPAPTPVGAPIATPGVAPAAVPAVVSAPEATPAVAPGPPPAA
jgi:sec-independent protein translocase protein TatA